MEFEKPQDSMKPKKKAAGFGGAEIVDDDVPKKKKGCGFGGAEVVDDDKPKKKKGCGFGGAEVVEDAPETTAKPKKKAGFGGFADEDEPPKKKKAGFGGFADEVEVVENEKPKKKKAGFGGFADDKDKDVQFDDDVKKEDAPESGRTRNGRKQTGKVAKDMLKALLADMDDEDLDYSDEESKEKKNVGFGADEKDDGAGGMQTTRKGPQTHFKSSKAAHDIFEFRFKEITILPSMAHSKLLTINVFITLINCAFIKIKN